MNIRRLPRLLPLLLPLAVVSLACDPQPSAPPSSARATTPPATPPKGDGKTPISFDEVAPSNTELQPAIYTNQQIGDGVGVPGVNTKSRGGFVSGRPFIPQPIRPPYVEAIRRTAAMAEDPDAKRLTQSCGLDVLNLTWEDTGRSKDSSVGPNISDMTIQVQDGERSWCMPVIRHPNFSDTTCDLDPHDFTLLVGNEHGGALQRVSLYDFLANPTDFLTMPRMWPGVKKSLLAPRDTRVLVSAQACFLPVPKQGSAKFNPVLFNYQSRPGNPAVLTILATREGTSVTAIDNSRDAFGEGSAWGQRLFHNEAGMRACLSGQRISDYEAAPRPRESGPQHEAGLSMVMLIQVPLRQRGSRGAFGFGGAGGAPMAGAAAKAAPQMAGRASDVETAVIGHGELEGPFNEIGGLYVDRDPDFPIRVTVQFYKATSNGVVSEGDVRAIKDQIDRVYAQSESVGSLVTDGETGRPTEYVGMKVQPPYWWEAFWQRHEQDTGEPRSVSIAKLQRLLGPDCESRPVSDLYLEDQLRRRARA